ncbi:MAG TPA: hypothetical protein PKE26_11130 [Kiritimatiellia bacterium]|nr:hypothetical protein [Kiritimatiellia bacterium]HMO99652.1 hypothetical protein [Kiritimatiellia bacterium]HMP98108.1 hypothetical protein [Kiritimatiellia bacterium]
MSQEWIIKSRARECAISGAPFADGAVIYSGLRPGAEGYERVDISEAAWNDAVHDGWISHWRSVYQAPPPPAEEPLKKETVETLLRQYMSKDDYSQVQVIYILAVMLERKRLLIERDVQRRDDGTKIRIYEHRQTGEIFTIPDPELRLDQIGEVQTQVNALLGIPSPPAPGA